MKITIITQNLCGGGVQKSVITLANMLKNEYKVSFLFFERKDGFFELPNGCEANYLKQFQIDVATDNIGYWLYEQRVLAMKLFFQKDNSDLYIVFEDYNSIVTLAANEFNKRIIVSSRVSLEFYKDRAIHLLPYNFYIRSIQNLYPKAVQTIAVSDGVKDELLTLGVLSTSIYNGVNIEYATALAQEECEYDNFLLNIGRVDFAQKGQDDALKAFYKIHTQTGKNLVFIGDGKDFDKLKKMVLEFGLENRVFLVGSQKNPYKFLKKCEMLIFSSFFEGMPNAVLEAMALGTPIISYDFLPSSKELSQDGTLFVLVDRGDIGSLAEQILLLLQDKNKSERLGKTCLKASYKFESGVNADKWINCVKLALQK